jgi:hypothetical protein
VVPAERALGAPRSAKRRQSMARGFGACFGNETKRDIRRKQARAKTMAEESHRRMTMKSSRVLALALIALVAVAAVPGSIGADNRSTCGIALTSDANLQRLDRVQSASAAKICAIYLNTIDARLAR